MVWRTGVIRGFSLASSLKEDEGVGLSGVHQDVAPPVQAYLQRFDALEQADRHRMLRQIGASLRPNLTSEQARRLPLRVRSILSASKRAPQVAEPQPLWRRGYSASTQLVDQLRRIALSASYQDCAEDELRRGRAVLATVRSHAPQAISESSVWTRIPLAGTPDQSSITPTHAVRILRITTEILKSAEVEPLRVLGAVALGFELDSGNDPSSARFRLAGVELLAMVEAQWPE